MRNLRSLSIQLYCTRIVGLKWAVENIPYKSLLPILLRTASLPHMKRLSVLGTPTGSETIRALPSHFSQLEDLASRNVLCHEWTMGSRVKANCRSPAATETTAAFQLMEDARCCWLSEKEATNMHKPTTTRFGRDVAVQP